MPHSIRRLLVGVMVLIATSIVATMGYVIAGWAVVDAIYMVTITIFGVGYGEVQPINHPGLKLFTVFVIISGCSSGIYVIGGILQMVTEGEIKRIMGVRNLDREIEALHGHAIICGYGRVGRILAAQLMSDQKPLLVVDRDAKRIEQAIEEGFLAIAGDATEDETLVKAGIRNATSLATVLPNDAMNVFITLTARELCERVQVIARAESPTTERKLIRSGANQVVMPAAIGALRIAELVTVSSMDGSDSMAHETTVANRAPDANQTELKRELVAIQEMQDDLAKTQQQPNPLAQQQLL